MLVCKLQMLETPLSRSAHNGHLQTVRHLLDQGADVNCLDLVRPERKRIMLLNVLILTSASLERPSSSIISSAYTLLCLGVQSRIYLDTTIDRHVQRSGSRQSKLYDISQTPQNYCECTP